MKLDLEMNEVLLAIFDSCGRCVDIATADEVWLAKLPTNKRQSATEIQVGRLAALEFIRRGPGHAAVTIGGLMHVRQLQTESRRAA